MSLVRFLLALALALLAWPATGASAARKPPNPAATALLPPAAALRPAPVDPALLRQAIDAVGPLHFIVELADAAPVGVWSSAPDAPAGAEARRAWLVERLRTHAQTSQRGVLAALEAGRAQGQVVSLRPFWIQNAVGVIADADTLLSLAARADVARIREDRWLRRVDPLPAAGGDSVAQWNITQVRAQETWAGLGLDGAGVVVAVVDTGVDWLHPLFHQRYRGYNPHGPAQHSGNWACTTDDGFQYPVDGHGHGTHVTGIAVGGQDPGGVALGVAPGAQWIAVKAFNNQGLGYDSWIHAALEWVLAPAGDPALAPNIVNNSWGNALGDSEVFKPDFQALRAAGIVPVTSAGNSGPEPGSVGSPASLPEAIAVGATNDLDEVAFTSSRGPSPWGEVKPELSAPGVFVRSSLPGGTYGAASGTSMAAPHVSGAAALLLQASPSLTVDELEALLTSTAAPIGSPVPNNDAGWGRLDTFSAAAALLGTGQLGGRVASQAGGAPVAMARVSAHDHDGALRGQATTDADGRYLLSLAPGIYDVSATAFGFEPAWSYGTSITSGLTTTLSFGLVSLPTGWLSGTVTEAGTGAGLQAAVSALGTPAVTTSVPGDGTYSLQLPAGVYTVEVRRNGSRVWHSQGIAVVAGSTTRLDASLEPAPSLLLVDSGPWYSGSQIGFIQSALDDRAFAYDNWPIRHLPADLPAVEDLSPYSVVVWSAPEDAPGYIGAGDVISTYLSTGGNLLLTGQDVGLWDGGLTGVLWSPYYTHMLRAQAVADDAGDSPLVGAAAEMLEGLTLPLNLLDGAANQKWPDEIGLLDPRAGAIVGTYADDGDAALRVGTCLPYRAVYLGVGIEGLGDRAGRSEALERMIGWLGSPRPAHGLDGWPAEQQEVWLGPEPLRYTWTLRNTGTGADSVHVSLGSSTWPTSLWTSDFRSPLPSLLSLDPCQELAVGVQVDVPSDTGWDQRDEVVVIAQSLEDPAFSVQTTLRSKTPAPVLLVDDHRWYPILDAYRAALLNGGFPFDEWVVNDNGVGRGSPTAQRLAHYPVVVWFTGYDWFQTLTTAEETRLAGYLEAGGRLLLSSQDYLYTRGLTRFGREYLGIADYTEGLTVTVVTGSPRSPVAHGMGPSELDYPFDNYSDSLRRTSAAQVAWWSQHGQPAALTAQQNGWKTAFAAFPLEALAPADGAAALSRAIGWMAPLGDSTWAADRAAAEPGGELAYALVLRNSGPTALAMAALSNTLPVSTTFVSGSLVGPGHYDPTTRRIYWSGPLARGQALSIGYRLALDPDLPAGAPVHNVARLSDESGLGFELTASSRVDTPDLSASTLQASRDETRPGDILTYTLTLVNDGLRAAPAHLEAPLPRATSYVPGSAWASHGILTATAESLAWAGSIAPGQAVTVTYRAAVRPVAAGRYLLNHARLDDGWGGGHLLEAASWCRVRLLFPIAVAGPE